MPPLNPLPSSYTTLARPQISPQHHPPTSPTPTPVILLRLERPTARNAFTDTMVTSLATALDTLSADVRANTFFCAGMDLTPPPPPPPPPSSPSTDPNPLRLARAKPTIAAGQRARGGRRPNPDTTWASGPRARRWGLVFVRAAGRGLALEACACACASYFLPRIPGSGRALELLTTTSGAAVVVPRGRARAGGGGRGRDPGDARPRGTYAGPAAVAGGGAPRRERPCSSIWSAGPTPARGIAAFREKRPAAFAGTWERDRPGVWPWWEGRGGRPGRGGEGVGRW
ncbi:ClpP/crotonase-like domain-containing protein [Xylariomycetidae sp. FL0641]|nr:ClpP/crotonase-like domain-containing protein [Xylariomycetidae sp. FL0641]